MQHSDNNPANKATGGASTGGIKTNIPGDIVSGKDSTATQVAEKTMELSRFSLPIVGYCGPVDENLDYKIIKQTALAHPEIAFVFVGPVVIESSKLPRLHNIHYLVDKQEEEMEAFINAFNTAMLPFKIIPSTMNLQPEVLRRYMLAGKPIISTPLHAVMRDYKHCIKIVSDPEDFSIAIKETVFYTEEIKKEMMYHYSGILSRADENAEAVPKKGQ